MRRSFIPLLLGMSFAGIGAPAQAQSEPLEGDLISDLRVRAEHVEREGLDSTTAVTWRARLGYEVQIADGWRALVEGEAVGHLNDDFSDSINVIPGKAVVADPEALELNRLQLAWSGQSANATIGRQRIILGNGRFIGNVGFRQNEQTFDALRFGYGEGQSLKAQYIYIDRVHRIFGDDSPVGEFDSDSHIISIGGMSGIGDVTATALLLDLGAATSSSSSTYVIEWVNSWKVGDGKLALNAQLARQGEYRGKGPSVDLGFQSVGASFSSGDMTFEGGVEVLEGSGGQSFATPLATLHAFQGWADNFLTTPAAGIRDLRLGISGKGTQPGTGTKPLTWSIVLHDFESDNGALDYGSELDAVLRVPLTEWFTVEAKAAMFRGATSGPPDTDKIWLAFEASF